ncbi:hypothetical protein EELLY_v1c00420 [Entomoplasma ellychniae]|uniref:Uncharacterized protein n=1 Tax=Entomoplasma ellychniae TaxID=2114 RepID=A0A8E2UDR7_9MOLU|nr:hypothetical protein [Entomoplasma ellychniae]PPE04368.1 hypothetical protein EELLY_v1c00420 [Entomoplasma ellychniae]
MSKLIFDKNNYEVFDDYNDVMIQVFGIGCSLCYDGEIFQVLKNHPIPFGKLLKEKNKELNEQETEKLFNQQIKEWQTFEDKNFEFQKPTFICETCWNEMI